MSVNFITKNNKISINCRKICGKGDGVMKISVGKSRMSRKWENKEISWEEFCNMVKNTTRTSETVKEYKTMAKERQDSIKDVGGFVGGHLKDGRRKKGNVICRSMITLDIDYGKENLWEEITSSQDFKCCIYSTHKHSNKSPRLRLIIPLSRDVSEKEYEYISKAVAKELGEEMFDKTTHEASRLMYWPSTSMDGDFLFEQCDGQLLDADNYLKKYEKIKEEIMSKKEVEIIEKAVEKQMDPLKKDNLVGTFCRAYTIREAIETFLSHVYKPSLKEGRYDFVHADSCAGLIIYEEKFAYSHHATDPACGKLLNAFDLVSLHKFGTSTSAKNDSFKNMCQFIVEDKKVKIQLIKERRAKIKEEFGQGNEESCEVSKSRSNNEDIKKGDEDDSKESFDENFWEYNLELNSKGNIKDTLDNVVLIIKNDENLQNISFNCHKDTIDVRGKLPWDQMKEGWGDADYASLKVYISKKYKIYSPQKTKDAVVDVAKCRSYHPIKEYLESLPPWDKKPRVDNLLIDYFGAENTSYTKAVIRKTLLAAVKRVYKPGIKFDSVLILNGPQGIGKSTFFEKLGQQWFSDSLTITDMKDKSGPEKLQGYWILELGELAGMKKMEVETVKSFISRTDDKYRASYGISVESHKRQCVVVGSTNAEHGFLRDITGNRRFWPVKVSGTGKYKPWQLSKEEVDQIWAETLEISKTNEELYLKGEDAKMAIKEQCDAMETDDREGLIRAYLATLLPEGWDKMTLYDRRNFLKGGDFGRAVGKGRVKRRLVCNMEIWSECFGNEPSMMKSADSYAISAIMKKIDGWDRYSGNKSGIMALPIYGNQRCYEYIIN